MNKKIPFPIAIIIIVICAVTIGLIIWKYGLIPGIEFPITFPLKTTECKTDSDCGGCGSGCAPVALSQTDPCHVGLELNECACINNKCVVKPRVNITTDKTEYKQGEDITYTINNKLNKPIFLPGCNHFIIQKKGENGWEDYFYKLCESGDWPSLEINPNQTKVFTGIMSTYNEIGLFRVQLYYGIACEKYVTEENCESTKTIYSDEFTIKEGANSQIKCLGTCKCMQECNESGPTYFIPVEEGTAECSVNSVNKICCCSGV